jgi:hypothetical protein
MKRLFLLLTVGLFILYGHSERLFAQSVAESYTSEKPIQRGMLVALISEKDRKIDLLTGQNIDKLRGVVINKNDSPVTLTSEGDQVYVANSGTREVIVSNENGEIKKGDYISISSSAGIGMKASDSQSIVIGRAAADFTAKSGSLGNITNNNTSLTITRLYVDISVGKNPLQRAAQKDNVPEFLAKTSKGIAGKEVSVPRVYMAFALMITTTLISGSLLYGAVRGSLIAIGRNPLSRKLIIRNMIQVILTAFIIFVLGTFAVYLILRL